MADKKKLLSNKELVEILAKKMDMQKSKTKRFITELLAVMSKSLQEGKDLSLRPLGTIRVEVVDRDFYRFKTKSMDHGSFVKYRFTSYRLRNLNREKRKIAAKKKGEAAPAPTPDDMPTPDEQ